MGKRTYESDIVAMALLYRYESNGSMMLSYDKIEKFDKIINENLDDMNSSCGIGIRHEEDSELYFTSTDESGKLYAIIKPGSDIKRLWEYHVGCLPLDVIIASQMQNALDVIGLKLKNNKFECIYGDNVAYFDETKRRQKVLKKSNYEK